MLHVRFTVENNINGISTMMTFHCFFLYHSYNNEDQIIITSLDISSRNTIATVQKAKKSLEKNLVGRSQEMTRMKCYERFYKQGIMQKNQELIAVDKAIKSEDLLSGRRAQSSEKLFAVHARVVCWEVFL